MNPIEQSMRAMERARQEQDKLLRELVAESHRQSARTLFCNIFCSLTIAIVLIGWIYG